MANALQLRRGTTTQHGSFTGLAGEVTVDTTKNTVVVHDGSTAGGSPLLTEAAIGSTVQAYNANLLTSSDIGTSVQAYDADTTKNDVANTFTAKQTFDSAVIEKKVAVAASDIDLSLGNYFTKTISATTTFTVSNVASSGAVSAFVLELTNGGSSSVTFFSGVTWAAATPPTLTSSGVDVIAFFSHDGGTTWRGFVLGQGMA